MTNIIHRNKSTPFNLALNFHNESYESYESLLDPRASPMNFVSIDRKYSFGSDSSIATLDTETKSVYAKENTINLQMLKSIMIEFKQFKEATKTDFMKFFEKFIRSYSEELLKNKGQISELDVSIYSTVIGEISILQSSLDNESLRTGIEKIDIKMTNYLIGLTG